MFQFSNIYIPNVLYSFGSIFDQNFPQAINILPHFIFPRISSTESFLLPNIIVSSFLYSIDCFVEFCIRYLSSGCSLQIDLFCMDDFLLKLFHAATFYFELNQILKFKILLLFITSFLKLQDSLKLCLFSPIFLNGYFWILIHPQFTNICSNTLKISLNTSALYFQAIHLQLIVQNISALILNYDPTQNDERFAHLIDIFLSIFITFMETETCLMLIYLCHF
jgi:hypothetical protein